MPVHTAQPNTPPAASKTSARPDSASDVRTEVTTELAKQRPWADIDVIGQAPRSTSSWKAGDGRIAGIEVKAARNVPSGHPPCSPRVTTDVA